VKQPTLIVKEPIVVDYDGPPKVSAEKDTPVVNFVSWSIVN